MTLKEKLEILADSAKYDASCSSSGSNRKSTGLGNANYAGICHAFASDGRCVSLLKILMTNACIFDCKYCVNCSKRSFTRAELSPDELCRVFLDYYNKHYVEGLFLTSGINGSVDESMETIVETIRKLRMEYGYADYETFCRETIAKILGGIPYYRK